jgi:hypothetical protein
MTGNLSALQTTWAGLAAGSTLAKMAAINAMTAPGATIDIATDKVSNFLSNAGKMPGLLAFVNNTPATPVASALLAANYLVVLLNGSDGGLIPVGSQPGLMAILDQISADARTGITAANVTAFNNLCSPVVPWWQANGFSGPIKIADLIAAGNLS